jgi:hypothetical protein
MVLHLGRSAPREAATRRYRPRLVSSSASSSLSLSADSEQRPPFL